MQEIHRRRDYHFRNSSPSLQFLLIFVSGGASGPILRRQGTMAAFTLWTLAGWQAQSSRLADNHL